MHDIPDLALSRLQHITDICFREGIIDIIDALSIKIVDRDVTLVGSPMTDEYSLSVDRTMLLVSGKCLVP